MAQVGGTFHSGTGVGSLRDGQLVGGVLFEDYNGASMMIHAAGSDSRWLTRQFLRVMFSYAFEQVKVRKLIAPVASGNTHCQQFIKSVGFVHEATLGDAHPDGALILFTMTKSQCRWLSLKGTSNGQVLRSAAS